jgi:putative membrane protein insertion efficiency factor
MSRAQSIRLWPRRALALPVRAYRFFLSPWLGSACRFEPSCSRYALDALDQHGAAIGSYLAAKRLLRCHPWCDGGLDPVPARLLPASPPLTRTLPKSPT